MKQKAYSAKSRNKRKEKASKSTQTLEDMSPESETSVGELKAPAKKQSVRNPHSLRNPHLGAQRVLEPRTINADISKAMRTQRADRDGEGTR